MSDPRREPISNQKLVVWIALLALGAVLAYGLSRIVIDLFARAQRAERLESALHLVEPREARPGTLTWLPDALGGSRPMERFTREGIASDYLLALEELSFARLTKDGSGLRSHFQEGALEDALAASLGPRAHVVSWDHHLKLHFYAPDAATISFTDTHWYAQALDGDPGSARIARREMDVVMQLDDGDWRVHHWRVNRDEELEAPVKPDERLAAKLAALRGVNYVGRSAPFGGFWPGFETSEVRSDFRLAASLRLNAVRIFIPYPTPEVAFEHLSQLLQIARAERLGVIVTLLDGFTTYRLEDLPGAMGSLERLSRALRDPAVIAVDIKNEAERDAPKAGWNRIRPFLNFVAIWVRSRTGKPVTAGLSDPDPELARSLDFVTIHHYGLLSALTSRLERAGKTGKPVLLEEFGFHTQASKLPDPHTELEQAQFYADALRLLGPARVGFFAWTLHDFPSGLMPGAAEVERHLGLVRPDGSFKPAARVLLGEPPEPIPWWDKLAKLQALLGLWPVGLIAVVIFSLVFRRRYRARV